MNIKAIKRITIELSNLCNMSYLHTKCPLHGGRIKNKTIISATLVKKIATFCESIRFEGMICFHRYNEPTIDPRLMQFIDLFKNISDKIHIHLITNGQYFTKELEKEFLQNGVQTIAVSDYPNVILDDRLKIYDLPENDCKIPCRAPLSDLNILCNGDVGLCCWDWNNTVIFGNIYNQSIESVLDTPKINEVYNRLSSGDRYLPICKRCFVTR